MNTHPPTFYPYHSSPRQRMHTKIKQIESMQSSSAQPHYSFFLRFCYRWPIVGRTSTIRSSSCEWLKVARRRCRWADDRRIRSIERPRQRSIRFDRFLHRAKKFQSAFGNASIDCCRILCNSNAINCQEHYLYMNIASNIFIL